MPDLPDIRKEEPTIVHNVRQMLGCLPVLGSAAVGVCGLGAFIVGMGRTNDINNGAAWFVGSGISLIASALGFGVLAWLMWFDRRE